MALEIIRGTDGNEAVVIGEQSFLIGENPRQVAIPKELLEGIHLSDLPDETAVVPLGLALPAVPGQQACCQLFAFRDGMGWIRVGAICSPDAQSLTTFDCLGETVRERQERSGDIEEDDLQDGEPQHGLFYVVPFSEDIVIADALARVGAIALELDERCRELMRMGALRSLTREQSA